MVLLCSLFYLNVRLLKSVQYCVAPAKQLDVGNYVIALLCAVRLVLNRFEQSAWIRLFVLLNNLQLKFAQYCVAPAKQLDVGNYVIALLCAVRLVLSGFG